MKTNPFAAMQFPGMAIGANDDRIETVVAVVPATVPGFEVIWPIGGGDGIGGTPVIAWAITNRGASFPICAGDRPAHLIADSALKLPDGKVEDGHITYTSVWGWYAGFLEENGIDSAEATECANRLFGEAA